MRVHKIDAVAHICDMDERSEEDRELVVAAKQATYNSYAPLRFVDEDMNL